MIRYRHFHTLLICLGYALQYTMRVNLSVAIVAMMDNKGANPNFPEYAWSQQTTSHILSSFFWGYILVQIPAGGWARHYGGHSLLLYSVLASSILALLTPVSVSMGGWALLCAIRFCQGLSQGVTLPTVATLMSKWAPVEERSTLQTVCYSGGEMGIATMLATSGIICTSNWGWPGTFYLPGLMSVVWSVVWCVYGAKSPRDCKHISEEERDMIEESLGYEKDINEFSRALAVPWKHILTSKHFWVFLINHCSNNWNFYTLLTQIPTFIKSVLGKDINSNALLSALPYLATLALNIMTCPFANWLEKSKLIHLTVNRKIFNTFGQWIPAVTIIVLGFLRPDQGGLAIGLLIATVSITTLTNFGYQVNHLDLSSNFAGTLLGISNCTADVCNIFAILSVGYIVTDTTNIYQWRTLFTIAGCIAFTGNLMFLIFGSAKVQPWNEPQEFNLLEIDPLKKKPANERKNVTYYMSQEKDKNFNRAI